MKYTGTGASGQNIGHGLSSAPELIIIKNLTTAQNWFVYSTVTNLGNSDIDYGYLSLNYAFNHFGNSGISNPTSTVFNVGTSNFDNGNGDDYIAYCFTSITGYQKIGSYTGDGTTSNSITTGFEPRFLMIKRTDTTGYSWVIQDTTRGIDVYLQANLSDIEGGASSVDVIQINTDGFTHKSANYHNVLNGTYIYLAIK